MAKKNPGRAHQPPQKKFITDVDFLLSHKDMIVAGSIDIYVQNHSQRFDIARHQEKLEDKQVEFAEYIVNLIDDNVHAVDLKVYQKPEGEESKEAEEFKGKLDTLDIVQELDDMEMVQFYDFSNEIYGVLTSALSNGARPGKKLRKS